MKRTAKQERFCQEIANGKTQHEAYLIAYPVSKSWKPASVDRMATKLSKNIKVISRTKELTDKTAKKHDITRESLIAEVDELFDVVRGQGNKTTAGLTGAMLKGIELKAKLSGNFIEKSETVNLTFEQWLEKAEKEDNDAYDV